MVTALGIFFIICSVSAIFERLFRCYFAVPISLARIFGKKTKQNTHTHT